MLGSSSACCGRKSCLKARLFGGSLVLGEARVSWTSAVNDGQSVEPSNREWAEEKHYMKLVLSCSSSSFKSIAH